MARTRRDYYEVLGVSRDADQTAIKDAFRRLALRYHPDRNKESGAEERFREIAEAYAVLSDPKKRADYDRGSFAAVGGLRPEDLYGGIDFEDLFGGLGFDWGGGLFERFFGGRVGPTRGANIEVGLEMPLDRILTGADERVRVRRADTCTACRGSGAEHGTSPRPCSSCGGSGQRVTGRRERGVTLKSITACSACGGRGQVIDRPCSGCGGRGQTEREEVLTVKVPPGVEDGMALRIPQRGHPASHAGGAPGDLYVIVRTSPDPRFQRNGADLWHVATVGLADAVLGARVEVPTLEGRASVEIPPGTKSDAVLRLKGKGLPEFGGRRRGDLYVRVRLDVPLRVTPQARELWQRIRALERAAPDAARAPA
jgi:molecular chaperone DnaJ